MTYIQIHEKEQSWKNLWPSSELFACARSLRRNALEELQGVAEVSRAEYFTDCFLGAKSEQRNRKEGSYQRKIRKRYQNSYKTNKITSSIITHKMINFCNRFECSLLDLAKLCPRLAQRIGKGEARRQAVKRRKNCQGTGMEIIWIEYVWTNGKRLVAASWITQNLGPWKVATRLLLFFWMIFCCETLLWCFCLPDVSDRRNSKTLGSSCKRWGSRCFEKP